ncbi:MAG: Gfo/Idh/MocA family oxidoreductase [Gammaproteobacteria bacterium]|nr:Gfo/Idh/MocA family oxidoreductase [Gammaproteobacteria bacterium]MBU1732218.1 Gfo/Idh/MocA family oxidoreductase [Gammaproteobacteria bacterium]MBU1893252.1 Gfo/Idh/MocA family oxidoreductase [Gammaproteobacteria bacterium]
MAYRAAIAGCGLIGSGFSDTMTLPGVWSHADAYTRCPETDLVAVCDQNGEKSERCAKRWNGAAHHTDFSAMLDDAKPEIISICTPDALHYPQIKTALEHPAVRAVLAEKPLSLAREEAQELIALAAQRGVVLAVNYTRRYAAGFWHLKKMLDAGKLGKVQAISGFYTKGTLHNGAHWFDLARWLLGPIAEASGVDVLHEAGNDPTLDAALTFASGARGYLHGLSAADYALFEMDIACSGGRARIVDSGFRIEIQHLEDSPFGAGYRRLSETESLSGELPEALYNAVDNLARCLKDGATPRCTGEDALAALDIALAVRASA